MSHIVMLLANAPSLPDGDVSDRVEMQAALTGQGHIDEAAYADDPAPWTTRRITPDGRVYDGELIRVETGWAIRRCGSEDDPVWPFQPTILRPGEYATIRPPEGGDLTYRIVSVDPD